MIDIVELTEEQIAKQRAAAAIWAKWRRYEDQLAKCRPFHPLAESRLADISADPCPIVRMPRESFLRFAADYAALCAMVSLYTGLDSEEMTLGDVLFRFGILEVEGLDE